MISRGVLTGYRLPGIRAIRADLNEAEALVQVQPTALQPRKPFGPNARIEAVDDHELTNSQADDHDQAEVVAGGDQ
jgi:hypothetical protein